jgi:hypothetical protein
MAAPFAACGNEPVLPLDVDPPRASISATVPAPSTTTSTRSQRAAPPPGRTRTRTPTPTPTATTACLEPVTVLVTAGEDLTQRSGFCIAVGGDMRIEGQGPDDVSVDRPDVADASYASDIWTIRFVNPGTVVVTIVRDGQTHTIPVVVV